MVALNEEYVSVAKAAQLLKVSHSTLWRWIDQGVLPAYRFGQRRVLIKRDDLNRLITPARGEKGGRMAQKERLSLGPLTAKEQRQMLSAIEEAKRLQSELLKQRNGVPFPSSAEMLDELRDERARDLQ